MRDSSTSVSGADLRGKPRDLPAFGGADPTHSGFLRTRTQVTARLLSPESGLTPTARLLGLALLESLNHIAATVHRPGEPTTSPHLVCWPSLDTLSARTGISRRSITRHLPALFEPTADGRPPIFRRWFPNAGGVLVVTRAGRTFPTAGCVYGLVTEHLALVPKQQQQTPPPAPPVTTPRSPEQLDPHPAIAAWVETYERTQGRSAPRRPADAEHAIGRKLDAALAAVRGALPPSLATVPPPELWARLVAQFFASADASLLAADHAVTLLAARLPVIVGQLAATTRHENSSAPTDARSASASAWRAVFERLSTALPSWQCRQWFGEVRPIADDGAVLRIAVPDATAVGYIERQFREALDAAGATVGRRVVLFADGSPRALTP